MFVSLFFLFLLADGASSERKCTYQDVIKHLNLTYENKTFHMTRPTNYSVPTEVYVDFSVYAILEVREKDQIFVPYIDIKLKWTNEFVQWNETEFCGITYVTVPAELVWKPQLIVEEATEGDKSKPSPYVRIFYDGMSVIRDKQVLVCTCKMQVYRFPFDTQSCNLTFTSFIEHDDEIEIFSYSHGDSLERARMMIQRQSTEWELIDIKASDKTDRHQSSMMFTIEIKRRSALYIVNFILPILFFLCLDLASFLISDTSGEKLGFKVTVLLAVTVMQLILNEILPSSSERIPLIAIYCIEVFALMMLSLLESVLMMYLIEKDNAPQDNETDEDLRLSEDKQDKARCEGEVNKRVHSSSDCDVSPIEKPSEKLPVSTEDSNIQLMEASLASYEMRNLIKTLLLSSRKEEAKPGYWTRVAKRINMVFFICYVLAIIVFLSYMFSIWTNENE